MTATEFALSNPRNKTDLELIRVAISPAIKELPPLAQLARMGEVELQDYGLSAIQAAKVVHTIELARRICQAVPERKKAITSSWEAYLTVKHLEFETQEVFVVVSLDRRNQVLGIEEVHRGGQDDVLIDPRVVFRKALANKASSIIVAHNHLSGKPSASAPDERITAKLVQAGELLGLKVQDHIIVGHNDYFSFADRGKL